MRDDVKLGLAAVALMAVCCGGPVFLSLLASGAALGALGSVWSGGRLLLPVSGALLIAAVAWLRLRRYAQTGPRPATRPRRRKDRIGRAEAAHEQHVEG